MLLPTDLLPFAFGIRWGMSQETCLRVLQAVPIVSNSVGALVTLCVGEEDHEIELQFGDHDALGRIRVDLYESRSFWDDDPDWSPEEVNSLYEEADTLYQSLIRRYSETLGPPTYSGIWDWDVTDYPSGEANGALTYWTHPQGRLQLTNIHPDREFPIFVSLECYTVFTEN